MATNRYYHEPLRPDYDHDDRQRIASKLYPTRSDALDAMRRLEASHITHVFYDVEFSAERGGWVLRQLYRSPLADQFGE